jgi:hypothetical protein
VNGEACDFCAYYAGLERAEAPRPLSDITAGDVFKPATVVAGEAVPA